MRAEQSRQPGWLVHGDGVGKGSSQICRYPGLPIPGLGQATGSCKKNKKANEKGSPGRAGPSRAELACVQYVRLLSFPVRPSCPGRAHTYRNCCHTRLVGLLARVAATPVLGTHM